MPELETRLAREREGLLDAIEQPPLERIGARAAGIRHRRRARRAGAALAVVAVAGFAVLRPWSTDQEPPGVADPSPSPGVVYTDAGITINGLTGDGYLDPRAGSPTSSSPTPTTGTRWSSAAPARTPARRAWPAPATAGPPGRSPRCRPRRGPAST
ncbi:hypothetical protein Psuf_026240 [Phytohabitans suffuscus]|uniref:Uncharacterized protein n=1 Tax=Phytohabitans suffuscus TaxID=624315 RepID=A0A6F8YH93_9ACTN|nr:hypothetical protein [Phytohabitans suffuscus]BCB85311.1 hypothetical protein Psuf_026240 [Phytohabitans suffuscus]